MKLYFYFEKILEKYSNFAMESVCLDIKNLNFEQKQYIKKAINKGECPDDLYSFMMGMVMRGDGSYQMQEFVSLENFGKDQLIYFGTEPITVDIIREKCIVQMATDYEIEEEISNCGDFRVVDVDYNNQISSIFLDLE